MAPHLRLVKEPPDAPLDPVREIIEARDALVRLQGNPLINVCGSQAVDATLRVLDRRIPSSRPKAR